MKVLVVGQGGREHALVKALSKGSDLDELHVLPGSEGMAVESLCHIDLSPTTENILSFCKERGINLVIVGPEQPLVDGLYDVLRQSNIPVIGCSKSAARLEGSKVFSKEFMTRAKVPTAPSEVVTSVSELRAAANRYTPPYVLKADGLAGGKGVFITHSLEELLIAGKGLFEDKLLGASGEKALLEQFQPGYELSVFVLTNGQDYKILPMAQDHKRLLDGQQGPNTGGMGTVAPMKISDQLKREIENRVVRPSVHQLAVEGLEYRGVLFIGLMMTPGGPSVLEYNVRWGDPEAQVLLPLLKTSWMDVFLNLANGQLIDMEWSSNYATCVVLAAPGYPDQPKKGLKITFSEQPSQVEGYLLHAGTSKDPSGQWITKGGRVLNAVGVGPSLEESRERAYALSNTACWNGIQKRLDIGAKSNLIDS